MRVADRTAYEIAPLYDAVQQGLNVMASAHYRNRALIVITDGVDFTSSVRNAGLDCQHQAEWNPGLRNRTWRTLRPCIPYPLRVWSSRFRLPARPEQPLVDTGMLERVTAPNGGQLLIVPQPLYDPRVTLNDELNSTVAALNHGYAIGVVAPRGSAPP